MSSDGLSLLDVAVIQKNGALAKILQAHGATEVNHGKDLTTAMTFICHVGTFDPQDISVTPRSAMNYVKIMPFMYFFWDKDSFGSWLDNMVVESEKKSENLMARLLKCSTFGSLTSAQLKELEKDFHLSEKRYKKLQKMRTDYAQISKQAVAVVPYIQNKRILC